MYQVSVYTIAPNLWRWELRCGGALLRCGTAPTRVAAEVDVNDVRKQRLDSLRDELAPETLLADVQRVWGTAVSASISAEAQPVSERGGVLTVSCAASVWAQELDLMGPTIVERLNALLRAGEIARLRCVTTPPRSS